jgi:adenosylmethionine-8-amino-7-oxononanoate transaminase
VWETLDKEYLWHPYTQMKDWMEQNIVVIERAEGFHLIDVDGNRYVDGVASIWCNVWGHGREELIRAIVEQAETLQHSTLLGLSNIPAIELAEKLAAISPGNLKRVFYAENGASAVEIALKMAVQYWKNQGDKREQILSLENGYHGDTAGAMSVSGTEFFFSSYQPLLFKSLKAPSPYCYRCSRECDGKSMWCIEKFAEIIEEKGERLAAVIMESMVQMAGGGIVFPEGYLKRISKLCRKNDVLLILDEVATGLGRTGKMFACEHEEVVPDIIVLGKMLSGGYLPISAVITTEDVFQAFLGEYHEGKMLAHGHTFTGNPVACRVSLVNLELYEKEKLLEKLKEKEELLVERVKKLERYSVVGDIRHFGFFAAIELVKNRETGEPFTAEDGINYRITQYAMERGVFLRPIVNIIFVVPPLAIDMKNLEKILDAVEYVVEKIDKLRGNWREGI